MKYLQLVFSFVALLAAVAIAAHFTGHLALLGPFAATAALVAALPASPFSRPRVILLGHLICVGAGLSFAWIHGSPEWTVVVAAAAAVSLMVATNSLHAPAVAHTAILIAMQPGTGYALTAMVCASLAALAGFAAARWQRELVARA